jgi:hypothetical protein
MRPSRSRFSPESRRSCKSPIAPLLRYRSCCRYRPRLHWRHVCHSLLRYSGSIQCSIHSEMIRASRNSWPPPHRKRTPAASFNRRNQMNTREAKETLLLYRGCAKPSRAISFPLIVSPTVLGTGCRSFRFDKPNRPCDRGPEGKGRQGRDSRRRWREGERERYLTRCRPCSRSVN